MAKWNVSHISKPEELEKLMRELADGSEEFSKHRSRLKSLNADEFIRLVKENERLAVLTAKLLGYAQLWLSEKTNDSKRTSLLSRASELAADSENKTLFFEQWFKNLSDEKAGEYLARSGPYRYFLERLRAYKKHSLEEKEEQIINLKDLSGAETLTKLYDVITNRYEFDYKGRKLSQEELQPLKYSPERAERVAAYKLVLEKYCEEQEILSELYKAIVQDWKNEHLKLRNFKTPISVRNFRNDLPDESVSALLEAVRENKGLFQDYFKLKYSFLKLKDRYDALAPYKEEIKTYPYEESKKLTLETYKEFSKSFYEKAKKIFDEQHVHSEIQKNKRRGAFCYSLTTKTTPYILLNHMDKYRDLSTMMHEFGHGIHSLTASNQTNLTFQPTLPLAETASVFGEMLLAKKMLRKAGKQEKISLLMKLLEDNYSTITRQAYFTIFEIQAHEKIARGAGREELNKLYLKNLKEQFGSIPVPKEFQHEWSYIPHIHHTPFYCYAYAFGNLLVLSLFKMYEEEGEEFIPKYEKILSYGGSEKPEKILLEAGINIKSKEFWEKGFEIIKENLEELKKLLG